MSDAIAMSYLCWSMYPTYIYEYSAGFFLNKKNNELSRFVDLERYFMTVSLVFEFNKYTIKCVVKGTCFYPISPLLMVNVLKRTNNDCGVILTQMEFLSLFMAVVITKLGLFVQSEH